MSFIKFDRLIGAWVVSLLAVAYLQANAVGHLSSGCDDFSAQDIGFLLNLFFLSASLCQLGLPQRRLVH